MSLNNMELIRPELQRMDSEELSNQRNITEDSLHSDMEDLRSELEGLSAEQLHDLRDIIEEELESLEQYTDYWKEFYSKYMASVVSLDILSKINANENASLIKIGNHVFTPGKLIRSSKVLVYLGDGYYAKMDYDAAKIFFQRKIGGLLRDMKEYEEGNDNKQYIFMLLQETLENKIRVQMSNLQNETQIEGQSSSNPE